MFWSLRSAGGLSYEEIRAYMELTGEELSPKDVRFLRMMDSIVEDAIQREARRGQSDADH